MAKSFVAWLKRNRFQHARLNLGAAKLLATTLYGEADEAKLGTIADIHSICITGRSPVVNPRFDLEVSPEQVFVIVIVGAESELFVIKSDGMVVARLSLPTTDWERF